MTLITSISGIRGTIGGSPKNNLTPIDAVRFAAAYGTYIAEQNPKPCIVIGRDARISGNMIQSLVQQTLVALGIDIIDLGLSTTPTVEMEVIRQKADGGIILTASHNPKQWNALKLLNNKGEFLNADSGSKILAIAEKGEFSFAEVDDLGQLTVVKDALEAHIDQIIKLKLVNVDAIKKRNFTVVVDAVNSSGGIAVPALLDRLGVKTIPIHCEPSGDFQHNPEPLAHHLSDLSNAVINNKADLGIAVDPDVDRLVFMNADGTLFGEEYTLVACADYVLSKTPGNTVSNLSSTRALAKVTASYGGKYTASAVGEVNVVEEMKLQNAIIGGEGNGGVILPELHYGRDALVGIALFLTHLSEKNITAVELKNSFPQFFMRKEKMVLSPQLDVDHLLKKFSKHYANEKVTTIDGVKVDFKTGWVHLRKSNTEPIIRVYTESTSIESANDLAQRFCTELLSFV